MAELGAFAAAAGGWEEPAAALGVCGAVPGRIGVAAALVVVTTSWMAAPAIRVESPTAA